MKTIHLALSVAIVAAAIHAGAAEPPLPREADATVAFFQDTDAGPAGGTATAPRRIVAERTMEHSMFSGERQAETAAAEGPERLRRFIGRTQGIFPLRFEDYQRQW